jgi:dihydrofolate synthase/folylpolyglutamate synthase
VVGVRPYVVLDGAQNASSASVLRSAIKDEFKYRRLVLVFGVSNDKDIQGIAKQLEGLADIVILTRSLNPRASDPRILSKYFINKQSFVTRNVREARRLARKIADTNDLILVTGSLFVVGEYRDDKKRFH